MPSKCPICGLEHATLEELQELEQERMRPTEEPKKKRKGSMAFNEDGIIEGPIELI
jgi:hypothetical protein